MQISGDTLFQDSLNAIEGPAIGKFELSFPASAHPEPITGRLFLIITRSDKSEPRLQLFDVPVFGVDITELKPGTTVIIDDAAPGYLIESLRQIPSADYYVQAVLSVYTKFHRADGHTVWAHMDQWEGQDFGRSPGNLVSEVVKVHLQPQAGESCKLELGRVIPAVEVPDDTEWVQRIKFRSRILSEFWGHPIYLGATALLPRGYQAHPEISYPVIYVQGHFSLDAPFGFKTEPDPPGRRSWARQREECRAKGLNMPEPPADAEFNGALYNVESGYEFYQTWNSDNFPRAIAVTFQHPTPYFDDSYGINSASAGPYGDAIMQELIPAIENRFRVIREPYARVLTGCSTGGWGSLALQVYHPDFFGGVWCICPDPVDFRRYYGGVNLYDDTNAFVLESASDWVTPERYCFRGSGSQVRLSNRQFTRLSSIIGPQDPGYGWTNHTLLGRDGCPRPVWNLATGEIDREVVKHMKEQGYDLRGYMERYWPVIGPDLVGKLHLYCGDEDGGYFNLAVYMLEDFLKNTKEPHFAGTFTYGRPLKGHGWQPFTNADLVATIVEHVRLHTPEGEDSGRWSY